MAREHSVTAWRRHTHAPHQHTLVLRDNSEGAHVVHASADAHTSSSEAQVHTP